MKQSDIVFASGRGKIIRDPAFAARLEQACDGNPHVPPMNYGRLTWIRGELSKRFQVDISLETVRKWVAGEAKPKQVRMSRLAQLLQVDEAWLSIGIEPDMKLRDRRARNAVANGAINVLAGFVQMGGGAPAFPEDSDVRANRDHVDLYAVIKGASYAFHVSLATSTDDTTFRFSVPLSHESLLVVGVIVADDHFCVEFAEIKSTIIQSKGVRKGGHFDVTMTRAEVDEHLIKSFGERL